MKAAEQNALADGWVAAFDVSNTGKLNKEETNNLLSAIKREYTGNAADTVGEALLNKIMDKFDYSNDGSIEKKEIVPAVKRYRALLKHELMLNELFAKHDTDNSGELSPEQLLSVLEELAAKHPEAGKPTADGDVAWVIERCDKVGNGNGASTSSCAPHPFLLGGEPYLRLTRAWSHDDPPFGSDAGGARTGGCHVVRPC